MSWLSKLGKAVGRVAGRVAMRVVTDRTLWASINHAVQDAEGTGMSGGDKMNAVIKHVKSAGGRAVLKETESSLRTKIERAIDLQDLPGKPLV